MLLHYSTLVISFILTEMTSNSQNIHTKYKCY